MTDNTPAESADMPEALAAKLAEANLSRLRAAQDAMVGAVIQEAARRCEAVSDETLMTPDQRLVLGPVAARIRALRPGATSALERMLREARNDERERSLTLVKALYEKVCASHTSTMLRRQIVTELIALEAAIRAMKEQPE